MSEQTYRRFRFGRVEGWLELVLKKQGETAEIPFGFDQACMVANVFAAIVERTVGKESEANEAALFLAFGTAAMEMDAGRDSVLEVGTFSGDGCQAGRAVTWILHDVWKFGGQLRLWLAHRLATCPAHERWLVNIPVAELVSGRMIQWEGLPPADWTPFALLEGVEWGQWLSRCGDARDPWAAAVVTALVGQIEANLASGMPFAEAAEAAHRQVVGIDYRPRGVPFEAYKGWLGNAAWQLFQLRSFWPRFEELRAWAVTSPSATLHGTHLYLRLPTRA